MFTECTHQNRKSNAVNIAFSCCFVKKFHPKLEDALLRARFNVVCFLSKAINQRDISYGRLQIPVRWFQLKHTFSAKVSNRKILKSKIGSQKRQTRSTGKESDFEFDSDIEVVEMINDTIESSDSEYIDSDDDDGENVTTKPKS